MIIYLILAALSNAAIIAIGFVTTIISFGQNDHLVIPTEVITAMSTFKETVNTLLFYMPWLDVVWTVIIYSIWVKVIIFIVEAIIFRRRISGN